MPRKPESTEPSLQHKIPTALALFALFLTNLSAQTTSDFRVVASTSWTAAFARAAGAKDITTIAPLELRHPPEYEIKPSDLMAVSGACFLVHSGYERFAKRLAETAGNEGLSIVQVYTDNIPDTFKAEARKLAIAFGTLPAWETWAVSFDATTADMKARVGAAYPDKRVAVHKYLKTFAEWLGFNVVATFGPGEPSPALLLEIVRAKPALIIDNYHNPSAKAIMEAISVPLVTLVNFPGPGGNGTIDEVFAQNEESFLLAASDTARKGGKR